MNRKFGLTSIALAGALALGGCGVHPREEYKAVFEDKPVTVVIGRGSEKDAVGNNNIAVYSVARDGFRVVSYDGVDIDENGMPDIRQARWFDGKNERSISYEDGGKTVKYFGFNPHDTPDADKIKTDIETLVWNAANNK